MLLLAKLFQKGTRFYEPVSEHLKMFKNKKVWIANATLRISSWFRLGLFMHCCAGLATKHIFDCLCIRKATTIDVWTLCYVQILMAKRCNKQPNKNQFRLFMRFTGIHYKWFAVRMVCLVFSIDFAISQLRVKIGLVLRCEQQLTQYVCVNCTLI